MTRDDPPELVALRELHRVVLLVNSAHDLDDVLQTAAQGVIDVAGFRGVAVNLVTDRGDFQAVTVLGPARDALLGARTPREVFLAELAMGETWGELCFVPQGRDRPHRDDLSLWVTSEPAADGRDAWLPEDALYAPLKAPDGDLVGVLSVDLPDDGRRPGAVRREVLEMYAVQIGLAISHARERKRLSDRLRLSRATHTILQAASESELLDALLESCIEPLQDGYRAERTWLRLFADPGGAWGAVNYPADLPKDLDAAAEAGLPSELTRLDPERALASAERVARECWGAKRTVVVSPRGPDTSAVVLPPSSRQRVLEWLSALGHQQFILVPLGAADQCLGYVAFNRHADADWTREEDQAALEVGRELGRSIGTARLRAREQELLARMEDLDDYKSRVVTTIIHELKNPLAVVMGNLELAGDEPELAPKAHAAIARGAERMQGLVEDLLTLTRLREPVADVDRTTLDLSRIVLDVVALIADQAEIAGVDLDTSGVQLGVTARAEPSEMDRLVLNLVSNAIKYSDDGDVVTLRLLDHGDDVEFSCADTGLGIAPRDMHAIFDEFERSSNPAARLKPGSGVGLAIVRRIIQRQQGSIEVTSQLGRGSAFVVRLPST